MAIIIYGAGGQARVLIELMDRAGIGPAVGLVDDNASLHGTKIDGIPVLGTLDRMPALVREHQLQQAVIAVGNNAARKKCATQARSLGLRLPVLIHPSAYVSPTAKLGAGTVVLIGAVIGAHAIAGELCIINTRSSVDHECILGDFVHIAPGVTLAGSVHVGSGTLIGVGASVLPGIRIGEDAIVGAGAVVIGEVPSRAKFVGNPARALK